MGTRHTTLRTTDKAILDALTGFGPLTIRELGRLTQRSKQDVTNALGRLSRKRQVHDVRVGRTHGGTPALWLFGPAPKRLAV